MTLFVVVLTAVFGLADVHSLVFPCGDVVCVADVMNHAREQSAISRVRVWRAPDYAPLPTAGRYVWPPVYDQWLRL